MNQHDNPSSQQPHLDTLKDCQDNQDNYVQQKIRAFHRNKPQERQQLLQDYDILDSPPEEAFDKITRLAAQTFQVPISMITFIDTKRQWFKSHHGTDLQETDLSSSFCLCAVQDGCTLVVPNVLEDSRFFNNPSVTSGLELRYYVGAPLITPEGLALGSLCLIDTVPRSRPSAEQINMLETLASVVVDEMRLRRSLRKQKRIETRLQKLLADKNMLLKEIHHRVKNNLQLVSSMLGIHSQQLQDPHAKAALRESRERIGVIAKIHELMYANQSQHHDISLHQLANTQSTSSQNTSSQNTDPISNDLPEDHIDLAPLITDLASNVMRLASQPIALELDLTPIQLDVHRAIPVSLIINELLTNALKYAFTEPVLANTEPVLANTDPSASHHNHQPPTITVSSSIIHDEQLEPNTYPQTYPQLRLMVSDNGVGLPTDTDIARAASLGFTVVQTLSEQLGAHLTWQNQTPSGLAVSVLLPLNSEFS